MNYRIILLILSFLVFTGSMICWTRKFGWLRNISVYYYCLRHKWLFTAVFAVFSISLAIAAESAFMFAGAVAICFAGTAANCKRREKITNKVHNFCAKAGVIFGMLALIFDFGLWYFVPPLLLFICLLATYRHKIKNYVLVIEDVTYYIMWTGVLINIVKL